MLSWKMLITPQEGISSKGNITQLSRNLTRLDFGRNLSLMDSTFYLSDLLIGVGFVTGVTFTIHLGIVDFIFFVDLLVKISL